MQIYNGFVEASLGSRRKTKIAYSGVYTHLSGEHTPLLLLHGLSSSKELLMHTLAKELYDKARDENLKLRIIAIDWPGHGKSSNNLKKYGNTTLTDAVEAVVEALNLESFHLYGVSLGAMAAIEYTAQNPDKVITLGLQGPPVNGTLWGEQGRKLHRTLILAELLRLRAPNSLKIIPGRFITLDNYSDESTAFGYKNPFFTIHTKDLETLLNKTKKAEKIIIDNVKQSSPRALLGYVKYILEAKLENALVEISNENKPVLLVDGEYPEHIALDTLEYIKGLMPNADTLVIPNAGHIASVVYPEIVAEKLLHFIQK